jgi:hypothetical protein
MYTIVTTKPKTKQDNYKKRQKIKDKTTRQDYNKTGQDNNNNKTRQQLHKTRQQQYKMVTLAGNRWYRAGTAQYPLFFGYYGTMEGTMVVPVGTMGSMSTMGAVVLWKVLR